MYMLPRGGSPVFITRTNVQRWILRVILSGQNVTIFSIGSYSKTLFSLKKRLMNSWYFEIKIF
jgi:hypothetical protein